MKDIRFRNISIVTILLLLLTGLFLGASGIGAQTVAEQAAEPAVVGDTMGVPGRAGEAILETPVGTGPGYINPEAERGFLGIPGAPKPNLVLGLLWGIWTGWVFATVGAFGGIMAGVGHMTVFGLGPYAKTFQNTSPALNKAITDSIRVSNQFLVLLAAGISSLSYLRMKRLAWPVGLALGLGSIAGAVLIPWLTGGKITFSQYQGYFGLFVLVVGAVLYYETTPRGMAGKKAARDACLAFETHVKEQKQGKEKEDAEREMGIKVTKWGWQRIHFTWAGVEFSFNPLLPVMGGVVIAAISAFLGVGGGFLYVPFLTSIVGLPMFVVAGTSAVAVFISMLTSITSYITLAGAGVDWGFIGVELIGVFIGAMVGPRTQKYIPDIWLKRFFIVLAVYVGLRFIGRGFDLSWLTWIP